MSKVKMYKVTRADGSASHGGSGVWELPKGNKPGKWMPRVEGPKACIRGYHLVTAAQLLPWLNSEGLIVWEAEGRGTKDEQNDKTAFAEARLIRIVGKWNDRAARLFACDCAEHVLHFFEKERPNDDRPRKAIDAARAFVLGKTDAAARDAARDAAWAAAWAAAWDAAWAAAWAAARDAARDAAWAAAWDAARAAAGAAAWNAAGDAARAAERKYQTRRLFYWLRRGGK